MNNEPNIEIRQELINIFKLKQYSKLLEKISKLQINFNKSIFLLDLTGVVNSNLQNYEEAIKNFKSIIKINPLFADAYYNLGNIYKTLNLIDDSIKNYLKCIEIEPNKFEAHNNLGNIFRENNNIGLAIEKYLQCLEINPNYLIALQNFGICLQNFKFNKTSSKIDRHIINLLNQNNILRPVDIINSLINYIHLDPKFKLIQNQSKNNYAFIEKKNYLLENLIRKNKTKSKIYRVNYKKYQKNYKLIINDYFRNIPNFKNLSFIFAISNNLKLSLKKIINVANKFKQLDFRQQIIYQSKKLIIINDSKSTSLSSTLPLLQSFNNIYWILGGIAKKGDLLKLEKENFKNIKAYIYGKDKIFFSKILYNKIKYKISKKLNHTLLQVFKDLKKKPDQKKILLFSPSAASFDQFKNFEDRGKYFNKIIKQYLKK